MNRSTLCLSALMGAGILAACSRTVTATQVDMTEVLTARTTAHSPDGANREPLLASPLIKLPTGSIRPEGWLKEQTRLLAEGMTGRLAELSHWVQFEKNAWSDPKGEGCCEWEEMPYWFKGFADLAYVTQDPRLLSETGRWIDAVLASQRPDGYFGPEALRAGMDLWPHMIMLYAVRSHQEATGDARIVPWMSKFFRWLAQVPQEQLYKYKEGGDRGWWQWIRAADNLDHILWLYNRTGENWLIELAKVNHARTADWTVGFPSWHGVNICQCFRGPAQFYQVSKEDRFLAATIERYDTVMKLYGQVPGGMFGADENCREGHGGPRQAAETCSMVEMMYSHEKMLGITGNSVWADRCEEIAFNSLPPAMTADLKALHYLTAPNQVQLDRADKSPMIQNGGDMFSYSPYARYRCCQHNVSHGWPYFVDHLWSATPAGGLAACLYAPCRVKARVADGVEVEIVEATDYPFDDTIHLTITPAKKTSVRFPLALRVPGWSGRAIVRVNGVEVARPEKSGSWVVLTREWAAGDKVSLTLPMEIKTRTWETNRNGLSVSRGPLTYSLRIAERYAAYEEQPPRENAWPNFEVFPASNWNYALVVDAQQPAKSFTLLPRSGELAAQPFAADAAPLVIEAKARRLPNWKLESNGLIGELPLDAAAADEKVETVQLIPMGCARLRVSVFPHTPPTR